MRLKALAGESENIRTVASHRCPGDSAGSVSPSPALIFGPHTHIVTQPGLFIPKGTQLQESETLNHVSVLHCGYQTRLMASPLKKES